MDRKETLLQTLDRYRDLGIADQMNYQKFNLFSLVTHSAAMAGSTLNEIDTQLLCDENIPAINKSETEQHINLDLKAAYEEIKRLMDERQDFSVDTLKNLSAIILKNTGKVYQSPTGIFDASKGDLRLMNITAGVGGNTFINYTMVADSLHLFCQQFNEKRERLLTSTDSYEKYMGTFEIAYLLESIHPWAEGNGRMARLLMNGLQGILQLIPSVVRRENKAGYLSAFRRSREEASPIAFQEFMVEEHIKNLQDEIDNYMKFKYFNPIEDKNKLSEPQDEPQIVKDNEPHDNINEPHKKQGEPQSTSVNEPQRKDLEDLILSCIENNNKITREELAEITGTSLSTIKRRLKNLGDQVVYIGSGYSGHWELKN